MSTARMNDYDMSLSTASSGSDSSLYVSIEWGSERPLSPWTKLVRALRRDYPLPERLTPALVEELDQNFGSVITKTFFKLCGPCSYEENSFSRLLQVLDHRDVQNLILKETKFYSHPTDGNDFLSEIIATFPPQRINSLEIYLPWNELPEALLSGLEEQFRRLSQIPVGTFHLHCNGINSERLFQILSGTRQGQQQTRQRQVAKSNRGRGFIISPLCPTSEKELIRCLDCERESRH